MNRNGKQPGSKHRDLAVLSIVPAAIIVFIMAVAGALESYTMDKTKRSIRDLLDFAPKMAAVRRPEGEVFAGTLNESGRLEIQTAQVGEDTTLSRIVHLVQEAQETRAPIQNIADRFTTWFLPIVAVIFQEAGCITVVLSSTFLLWSRRK